MFRVLILIALLPFILRRYLRTTSLSILDDIWSALSGAASSVGEALSKVWDAIQSIFHGVEDVFGAVLDAWSWAFNGVVWLATTAAQVVWDVVQGIQWLIEEALPHVAEYAIEWAWHQIEHTASTLWHDFTDALGAAVHWLKWLVDTVDHVLTKAFNWVKDEVLAAWHWIDVAGKWVWDVVIHPDKLLAWIWDTLVLWILKELWSLAGIVLHYLWHAARKDAKGFIHLIEDVVSVIL